MSTALIADTIRNNDGLWFAVFDAAQVENAIQNLETSGLSYRCLYIGIDDKQSLKNTAPYLISLQHTPMDKNSDPLLLDRIIDLTSNKLSSLVFWKCDKGEDVLYKHLRGINMVDIPLQNNDRTLSNKFEHVVLRHADANVMAQVMPALSHTELMHCIGPADYVLFKPDNIWHTKLIHAQRDSNWSEAENTVLRISIPSYQKVISNREQGIINKIEKHLTNVIWEQNTSTTTLHNIAVNSFIEAKQNGIKTEGGFYRWSFFYYISNGEYFKYAQAKAFLTDKSIGSTVDERVKFLMKHIIKALKEQEK